MRREVPFLSPWQIPCKTLGQSWKPSTPVKFSVNSHGLVGSNTYFMWGFSRQYDRVRDMVHAAISLAVEVITPLIALMTMPLIPAQAASSLDNAYSQTLAVDECANGPNGRELLPTKTASNKIFVCQNVSVSSIGLFACGRQPPQRPHVLRGHGVPSSKFDPTSLPGTVTARRRLTIH